MSLLRHLIICVLLAAFAASPVSGQSPAPPASRLKLDYVFPPQRAPVAAALHPAAKGALIGAAAGAGFFGAVGFWYCTVGPNEVGECSNSGMWTRGFLVWSAAGAGIGALIGAIR